MRHLGSPLARRWRAWQGKGATALERCPARPWGPFCYVGQGRHPGPWAKRPEGRARRLERMFKQSMRDRGLDNGPERDDGYFPLGWY